MSIIGACGDGCSSHSRSNPEQGLCAWLQYEVYRVQDTKHRCFLRHQIPGPARGAGHRHHMFSSYEPELFSGLIYRMMIVKSRFVDLRFWKTCLDRRQGTERTVPGLRAHIPGAV
ncbi:hypothetical protein KC353_g48 [Hortaea werneckii]|nr:hypothetical protein KC353_g48 [Hortaea werneckii]